MRLERVPNAVKVALKSFLGIPFTVVAAFFLLALVTFVLDRSGPGWLVALRQILQPHLFADPASTVQVLSTVAGGMITLTSITFSLLLVALQQSASSMTHAIFDQFLRRRLNQVYAGWFVGVTLYTLITLASVSSEFNPILGATLSLLLAISALCVLLLLVYSTIEQMRPEAILGSIHDHTLRARERQLPLLRRTRREPQRREPACYIVRARGDGFVTDIDLDAIAIALDEAPGAEVLLRLPIGGFAAFGDPLAEIRPPSAEACSAIAEAVTHAIPLDRERDLDLDAAFGIEQIETIAWTTVSTSKQNPAPGLDAVRNLRDLLARWVAADDTDEEPDPAPLAVVYPDNVMERLMAAFGSLAVVASESMQHQVYAEVLWGLAVTLDRLPLPLARRAEEVVLRSLAGLGDHVLTAELDGALSGVADALQAAGLADGAAAVRSAQQELATTIGELNSRATRVPTA